MKQTLFSIQKRLINPNVQRTIYKIGHIVSGDIRKKMSDSQKKRFKFELPHNKGKPHSEEFKEKLKLAWIRDKEKRSGENHWNYKKDRSLLAKKQERNDPAYFEWRKQIWLRDNFKCRIDNQDCCGKIEAHHILSWKDYPELRYSLNNGITLCHTHHPRKRVEEKRLTPYFQDLVSVSND